MNPSADDPPRQDLDEREAARRSAEYWERRARLYARRDAGLPAVCGFGMPHLYNAGIDLTQRLALRSWLGIAGERRVLEVGCGVGRWVERFARSGASVTGVDISPTMLDVAAERVRQPGVLGTCEFLAGSAQTLELRRQFDLVLTVTMLQHLTTAIAFQEAIRRLADHLALDGSMLVLEAAPHPRRSIMRTSTFVARSMQEYLDAFAVAGLRLKSVHGVDPLNAKYRLVRHYRRLPSGVRAVAASTAAVVATPIDSLMGRLIVRSSWHKLFVLRHR